MAISTIETSVCIIVPPKINAPGVWKGASIFEFSLPVLQLQVLLIFSVMLCFHLLLKPLGFPPFLSQLLAGIVLGPSLLGRNDKFKEVLFPVGTQDVLGTAATLGYMLFMFLSAVKMDLGMVFSTGKKALAIGIASLVAPLVLGLIAKDLLEKHWLGEQPDKLVFVTAILSFSPFPVISSLLADLQLLNSELGRLGLSAGMVGEMCSVVLAFLSSPVGIGEDELLSGGVKYIGGSVGYILLVWVAVRPAMLWIVRRTPKGMPVKGKYILIIVLMTLGTGKLSELVGQSAFFGPFILGVAIPDGPPLGSALVEKLECFVSGILVPLFVTTSMMRAEFMTMKPSENLVIVNEILILVTSIAKIGSCLLVSMYCKMPFTDSLALALIMTCKGIVQLAGYSFLRDSLVINQETFAVQSITVLASAVIIPIAVINLYDPSRKYGGYQRRNIMNLKPNSELRILFCIYTSHNINAAINLLDASCPTLERPVAAYVLHLMKLRGRSSPIFISHQLQTIDVPDHSYSENVIRSFKLYGRNHQEALSMNTFTAISPPQTMHEDICTLALDSLTSLIVLPFHQTRNMNGSVTFEDDNIRALNLSVLQRAPCSVGIIVDRSHDRQSYSQTLHQVLVVFLGGKDDREALSFAKRMTHVSNTSLTVLRLIANADRGSTSWQEMLDSDALKDVKLPVARKYLTYREVAVKDGSETASVLCTGVADYDLVIVGRSHDVNLPQTQGLSDWSEFSELGVIGDLLASPDLDCRASILVIQQQQQVS